MPFFFIKRSILLTYFCKVVFVNFFGNPNVIYHQFLISFRFKMTFTLNLGETTKIVRK